MLTTLDSLPLALRQQLFLELVTAQDSGMPVAASRQRITERFNVSGELVRAVEEEGIRDTWPPL